MTTSGKQVGKPERSVKNHAELRFARLNPPKSEKRTLLHHCGPTQISELEQASGCRSWSVKRQFRVAVGPRLQTGHGTVQGSPLVLFVGHTSLRNRASFTGFTRERGKMCACTMNFQFQTWPAFLGVLSIRNNTSLSPLLHLTPSDRRRSDKGSSAFLCQ